MVFITFHYRYRKQIIMGIFITILLGGLLIIGFISLKPKGKKKDSISLLTEKKNTSKKKVNKKEDDNTEEFKVDIKGEINMPGIYTLKADSRVIDVIEQAGGLTDNADTSVINLSLKIKDEMVIIIYSKDQVREFEVTKEKEKVVQEKCNKPDDNSLKNDACIENNSSSTDSNNKVSDGGKISINSAGVEELKTLPGIGEAKAKDIVNYRETNGPFQSIEDITKVSGIGDSTFAQIKENITV